MDFCPKCGTRLSPGRSIGAQFCRKCQQDILLASRIKTPSVGKVFPRLTDNVITIDSDAAQLNVLPTTRVECPKCSHDRAHFRTLEIWDDEADIMDFQIYRCTKCKHTWREKA
jgi:DNA-directed RNA polymerase subunit M